MVSAQGTQIDFSSPDFIQNPYPDYRRLRESGMPAWMPPNSEIPSSLGTWLFSRYDEGLELFRQLESVSKDVAGYKLEAAVSPLERNMLFADGAEHLRLRRLVEHYFSTRHVRSLEGTILRAVDALIDEMQGGGEVDFIACFAERLPLYVIAGLLGIAYADAVRMRVHFVSSLPAMDSAMNPSADMLADKARRVAIVQEFIQSLFKDRQGLQEEGLLTFLLAAKDEGKISLDELTHMIAFLLFSGHETTISLLGNGLWLLLRHPEQWALLKSDPGRSDGAVEEILRMESPLQRTSFRMAVAPFQISGFEVAPGYQVALAIGAANRDPAVFADPDRFDILRTPNRHLAFGMGAYNCLGKHLARAEGRIAFARIAERLGSLRLVRSDIRWRDNTLFRGLTTLPVMF